VHLDVRKDRSAFWIDYSGPGGRAMYSDNPVADLKTGRADSYKPTTIDEGWVEGADQDGPSVAASAPGAEARVGRGPVQVEEGGDDDGPPSTRSSDSPRALRPPAATVPAASPPSAAPAPTPIPVVAVPRANASTDVNVPAVGSVARK
jgi:hypothetical protein